MTYKKQNTICYKHWIKVKCLRCNYGWLEVCAFVWFENGIEKSTPVLVCPSHNGCGTFFDPNEYDLTDNDLQQ